MVSGGLRTRPPAALNSSPWAAECVARLEQHEVVNARLQQQQGRHASAEAAACHGDTGARKGQVVGDRACTVSRAP